MYVMHLKIDELQELIDNSVSKRLEPLEKAINYLIERCDDEILKIGDVCSKLQVTERTIHNWVKAKKIKCYWIGDRQFFKMKDIVTCMKSNF